MATDLTAVRDHPARVLADHFNSHPYLLADTTGSTFSKEVVDEATSQDAINVLRIYERDHAVTFAALDNDTLAQVQSLYREDPLGLDRSLTLRSDEFIHAVADLLGLED